MNTKPKKIQVGSGKNKAVPEKLSPFANVLISATINPDKLAEHIQEFEGNKFVKLNIMVLNKPNQYGKDVEITIDDFKPTNNETAPKASLEVMPF